MPTNTRKAFRRDLSFGTFADLEAELAKLREAHHAGTLRVSGNWTPGQVLGHLAKWMGWYLDDAFPFTAPGFITFFGKLFRKQIISKPFKPGLRFKPKTGDLGGDPEYSFEEGWDKLQAQLDRVRAGESLACMTPLVGAITHDEALRLHLNHAMLHLSFLHYDGKPMDADAG
ncbi:MAG: DUF1569 domain-containing protein [Planctomycetota bacterium]